MFPRRISDTQILNEDGSIEESIAPKLTEEEIEMGDEIEYIEEKPWYEKHQLLLFTIVGCGIILYI